jgi:radical SAM/Cys-rich protein
MTRSTLHHQGSPLTRSAFQLQLINTAEQDRPFHDRLQQIGISELRATTVKVLQLNLGKLCNQACRHCHVDAGPDRRELMSREIMHHCLDAIRTSSIVTVDLTGGAPEMNPHFRWLVSEIRQLGRHVIDRCNLTILLAPGYTDLPEFLAEHQVEVVASLPCYNPGNTDRQRGNGVFNKSIEALRRLNALGYGDPGSGLTVSLVYNPIGPSLPPAQPSLEAAYRRELGERFGVRFSRLYTITNMPINRFLDDLVRSGRYHEYMQKLIDAFNPAAAEAVMCRTMISVNWDGTLSDCDFNQMLELRLAPGLPQHIRDWNLPLMSTRAIVTGQHCYGCTAGNGSSCQGATVLVDLNPLT